MNLSIYLLKVKIFKLSERKDGMSKFKKQTIHIVLGIGIVVAIMAVKFMAGNMIARFLFN
ncbi:hypothetical protein J8TS2_16330 [Lederbergia ruris]|uniref:DUF1146 domain-containing protein n=1 Tax=Lederbergia ruris TaxID=217495 RepID=A0ABQ4KIN9_9BACI|nr:hypothetical protein J8TS2_16330 [Lederbergia ruris]